MGLGLIELVILLGIPVAVLVLVCRPVGPRGISQWATHHGLALTPGNRPLVQRYLQNGRRLRVICVIGGLVLPPMIHSALTAAPTKGANISLLAILIGYLVGTLWAEIATGRPRSEGTRIASLAPRRLAEYLPRVLRIALRAVGIAGAAVWALAWFTYRHPARHRDYTPAHPSTAGMAAWVAVFLATPVLIEAVQRWILRRPQPMVAADLIAADDAIRSQSLHVLGGTGVAILLGCCLSPLILVSAETAQPFKSVSAFLAFGSFLAAIWFWRYYSNRDWRVTRGSGPTAPPVATGATAAQR